MTTNHSPGTALITGASKGIGAIYADRLARRGYDLIIVARNGPALDDLARQLRQETGRTVDVLAADLTQSADVGAQLAAGRRLVVGTAHRCGSLQ